jgi:hypothetical protein
MKETGRTFDISGERVKDYVIGALRMKNYSVEREYSYQELDEYFTIRECEVYVGRLDVNGRLIEAQDSRLIKLLRRLKL